MIDKRLSRTIINRIPAWVALFAILLSVAVTVSCQKSASALRPKLLLFIVIDQLRADAVALHKGKFGPNGFRYLMDNGLWYVNARHRHATTLTAVGHAVLFTGADAAQNGIPANDWFDPVTGDHVYCLEDPASKILGHENGVHEGASPRNLTSTTVADEVVRASGGTSRAFGVSLKDRGAILAAGRLGKAFWYWAPTGEFVTSSFYYPAYPDWVSRWNADRPAARLAGRSWDLLMDRSMYLAGQADDRPAEKPPLDLGRTFPHPLPKDAAGPLFDVLDTTPFGDELTLDFVLTLLEAEKVGRGPSPDVLGISFTATDYIGHAFGPDSLEYEDQVRRVDGLLARLFTAVDKAVGLSNTIIVLTADHGVDLIPEVRQAERFPAGRFHMAEVQARLSDALRKKFKTTEDLVRGFYNPCFFLATDKIRKLGLSQAAVEEAASEVLRTEPGVAYAVTRSTLIAGAVPDIPVMHMLQASFHPERSGHVFLIQRQGWFLLNEPTHYAAMHGSAYEYDIHVPLFVAGPGIRAGVVGRSVSPQDLAVTLASYLGIAAPTGSTGVPLAEVFESGKR
jgi:predicted AlkP superfamily pyrophosphatase or phosphodiesterase